MMVETNRKPANAVLDAKSIFRSMLPYSLPLGLSTVEVNLVTGTASRHPPIQEKANFKESIQVQI